MPQKSRWITFGCLGKKKDPGHQAAGPESLILRLFHGWKQGTGGQGLTDMVLRPLVFEPGAIGII